MTANPLPPTDQAIAKLLDRIDALRGDVCEASNTVVEASLIINKAKNELATAAEIVAELMEIKETKGSKTA